MGWEISFDDNWKRFIGYGVPAYCDFPGCNKKIDRGLAYVCGGEPYGGNRGCGLFFCAEHLFLHIRLPQLCKRCEKNKNPYIAKAEHPEWINHILTNNSWKEWRENIDNRYLLEKWINEQKVNQHIFQQQILGIPYEEIKND